MAALCSTSLRQLERHFAQAFQKSPGEWSRELRCEIARQYLIQGWSNKAVVQELGFTDGSHLCKEFKRLLGKTPQDCVPAYGSVSQTGCQTPSDRKCFCPGLTG